MFSDAFIERVRDANEIVSIISDYVVLEKRGKDYFGLCPFHREKTASFSVAPYKQIYYCFGCNKGGNVIHFIMEVEHMSFSEAVEYLAEKAGIPLEEVASKRDVALENLKKEIYDINTFAARVFFNNLHTAEGKIAQQYLIKRKITVKTATSFGLGYSSDSWDQLYLAVKDKGYSDECIQKCGLFSKSKNNTYFDRFRNRLMFPIFNISGKVIAFGARRLADGDNTGYDSAKYINSAETPVYSKGRNMYALNFADVKAGKKIIIVEGYMDVISMHQAGFTNSVASLGTALTDNQARLLKKFTENIVICYDADGAGQAATMRGLDIVKKAGLNVSVMRITGDKDPDDFIKSNGNDAFQKVIDNAITLVEFKAEYILKNSDIKSIDGKTEFANKLADLLSTINNSVERDLYTNDFSKKYNIGLDSFKELIEKRIENKAEPKQISTSVGRVISNRLLTERKNSIENLIFDERMLLVFLTMYKVDVDTLIKEGITADSFYSEEDKVLAAKVFGVMTAKGLISEPEFLNFVDQSNLSVYVQLFAKECRCEELEIAFREKKRDVKRDRIEVEIQRIKTDIESMEKDGDYNSDLHKAMLQTISKLIQEKAMLRV